MVGSIVIMLLLIPCATFSSIVHELCSSTSSLLSSKVQFSVLIALAMTHVTTGFSYPHTILQIMGNSFKQVPMDHNTQFFSLLGISLVVCRNHKGEYLTILENGDQGWWLPGGLVDPPESYQSAAIRETIEEAGINVELKGILRMEYNCKQNRSQRFKVVFYAEPIDPNQPVKTKADSESQCSRWVHYKDLPSLEHEGPGWRGQELLIWSKYIEEGGLILPMTCLAQEGSQILMHKPYVIKK